MSAVESDFYYKFSFECVQADTLVALLNELPFNGFEMLDTKTFYAYADVKDVDALFLKTIDSYQADISFIYSHEEVKMENWNAAWEKDFEPVIVDDFCVVRADFHSPFTDKLFEIIVTPQMSFGTGHHETTRGMIRMMRDMAFKDKKVLDFGCGTGILAILAAKMGAKDILGVDIDNNAYMNSIHNCKQNNVESVRILQGGLDITEAKYDVILANINRHVILETLPSLSTKLSNGDSLLLSGILYSDVPLVERHLQMASFKVVKTQQLEDWMCILTEKCSS